MLFSLILTILIIIITTLFSFSIYFQFNNKLKINYELNENFNSLDFEKNINLHQKLIMEKF